MSEYDISKGLNAKVDPVSEAFNKEEALSERIAAASPEAQARVRFQMKLSEERLFTEKQQQQRHHQFRLGREENYLLKKYIADPAPRPDNPQARTQDLAIIEKEAQRRLGEKEARYLDAIKKDSQANIQQILKADRAGPQHDEQEHER